MNSIVDIILQYCDWNMRLDEAKKYFNSFFEDNEGDFFECTEKEAKKAQLHRFVSASAFGRYQTIYEDKE